MTLPGTNISLQVIVQNVFISFCAGLFTFETAILYSDSKAYWISAATFFFTLAVYSILRTKDIQKYKPLVYSAITFSIVATCYLMFIHVSELGDISIDYSNLCLSLIFLSLIIVALYYPKSIFRKMRFEGLRQFTLVKPIIISVAWIIASVLLVGSNTTTDAAGILLLIEKFLFILALSIASDIVDAERDQSLRTIPVKYGIQQAKKIIVAILVVQSTCVCFTDYESYQKIIICAASFISGFFIYKLHYGYKHSSILLVDGLIVLRSLPVVLLAM